MERSIRASEITRLLAAEYAEADCELNFTTPWQLLVATVLSAQCTDEEDWCHTWKFFSINSSSAATRSSSSVTLSASPGDIAAFGDAAMKGASLSMG